MSHKKKTDLNMDENLHLQISSKQVDSSAAHIILPETVANPIDSFLCPCHRILKMLMGTGEV